MEHDLEQLLRGAAYVGNTACMDNLGWQRCQAGRASLVKRTDNGRSSVSAGSPFVNAHEFVLVGVLRCATFVDFGDLDTLRAKCPSAVISPCPMSPVLLKASRQVRRTCRFIEASIGHHDADKVHRLLFNGDPLIRFPPMLKGICDPVFMGDNSPPHCYNSRAFHDLLSAYQMVDKRARDLPPPADECHLAFYDDGCWISRPLPIYTQHGGLVLPRDYCSLLPGSLVEVHASVAYGHHAESRTEGFFFDAQRVKVLGCDA